MMKKLFKASAALLALLFCVTMSHSAKAQAYEKYITFIFPRFFQAQLPVADDGTIEWDFVLARQFPINTMMYFDDTHKGEDGIDLTGDFKDSRTIKVENIGENPIIIASIRHLGDDETNNFSPTRLDGGPYKVYVTHDDVSNKLWIKSNNGETIDPNTPVIMTTLTGRVLYAETFENSEWGITAFDSGIYNVFIGGTVFDDIHAISKELNKNKKKIYLDNPLTTNDDSFTKNNDNFVNGECYIFSNTENLCGYQVYFINGNESEPEVE